MESLCGTLLVASPAIEPIHKKKPMLHATEEDDPDGELLCDADLAVLAGDDDAYGKYTAAIRREYAHVPEDDFKAGRAQVLKALLELPSIYRLEPLREQWEATARANLEKELRG